MAKENAHTRFGDIVLDDLSIGMRAKGIFVTIGFLGNGCSVEALAQQSTDSEAETKAALDELVKAGYAAIEDGKVTIKPAATFGIT